MPRRYVSRGRGGRIELRLPAEVRGFLVQVMRQLDDLLDSGGQDDDREADPLEAITGMTGLEPRDRPDDPALLRLRPDAYAPDVDDGRAAAEYRRFTESDLEAIQRGRVATVIETLAEGGRATLDEEQAEAWLGALNDARLAVASRLGIDHDDWRPGPEAPDELLFLYDLLGLLFHELLTAVAGD